MARKPRDPEGLLTTGSPRIKASPEETFPSARLLKWTLAFLLVYFGLRLLFFAGAISPDVPPDERTHFGLSWIFSKVVFLPQNSPETYELGLVTNIPWLYYWIMGKLLALNFVGASDLLFLRLLNVFFAFGTVYCVWRMLRLLTDDRLSQVVLIVAMTNTIMFSFLSASVSYDNLANFLAAAAVYHLLAFFKNRSVDRLLVSLLCQMAGALTKSSFLPLLLVLNILLVVYEFNRLRLLPGAVWGYFKAAGWRRWGLAFGLFLVLALNLHLYGGNYVHYGRLTPEMSDVVSPENAMRNRLAARDMIFSQFKEGRITREEALARASQISHPGDRGDAIDLINNYSALKRNRRELMGELRYSVFWVRQMSAGIFGIFGHIQMANRGPTLWMFAALGALTITSIVVRWRPTDAAGLPACLMAIAATYGFSLLYYVNYQIYLDSGAPGLAVQGRYIFPVIGPIYVVSSYYLLRLFRSERLRLGVTAATCTLFIASDLPYFLLHVTSEWFIPQLW